LWKWIKKFKKLPLYKASDEGNILDVLHTYKCLKVRPSVKKLILTKKQLSLRQAQKADKNS